MTATVTGKYVDATSQTEIEAQIVSLGVAVEHLVIIDSIGSKIYIGKVVIT